MRKPKTPKRPSTIPHNLDIQYATQIQELDRKGDTESAHASADDLLCEILTNFGFTKTVEAFQAMDKWYS